MCNIQKTYLILYNLSCNFKNMMKILAHLVECKSPKEKIGVFDWVDIQHDEGGCQFFSFVWVWRCPSSCWSHSIPVAANMSKTYQVCAVAEGQHGWILTCLEIKAFWEICNSKKGLNYKLGHCLDSSGQFWGDSGLELAANNLDYQFWVQHICFTLLSESGSYSNITMASGALHGQEIKAGTKF